MISRGCAPWYAARRGILHKDELIQVHTLLCQLKNHFEASGIPAFEDRPFAEYESLGISPMHVHRSKGDHKRAIFLLGKELAKIVSTGEFSGPELVSHRFNQFAHRGERVAIPMERVL
ncbi:MAG: UPF0058 family protein [Thermoplasmatota archaeon]